MAQPEEPPNPIQPFEPETVLIPAGPFVMGSVPGDGIPEHETPQHQVDVPAYQIGRYPVTNRQYAEFIKRERRASYRDLGWRSPQPAADQLDHPVVGVSWHDARAYCDWLHRETGRRYRLPTEAEWEKAARGAEGRCYPWGNDWQDGHCHHRGNKTMPVTAYPQGASVYGCCDMLGNVQEWTAMLWGSDPTKNAFAYPYDAHDGREDLEADQRLPRVFRVYRGSSYRDDPSKLRCSTRGYSVSAPDNRLMWRGFRLVLEV